MATKKAENPTSEMRRCIGSARFGIEGHDAPVGEFPKQPSQKDGLGRMCKTHWNQYTAGLARDAKARKAAEAATAAESERTTTVDPAPATPRRARHAKVLIADALTDQAAAEAVLDALGGPFAAQ